MKRTVVAGIVALSLACTATLGAQSVRSLINGGNNLYKDEKYADAEAKYRKALEQDSSLVPGKFNLGNSLYKQGKVDEAVKEYETMLQPVAPSDRRAQSYYNIGNSYLQQKKYEDAIRSYVESLKLKPDDFDAKYNLSYALQMLKHQQQQKQNKDKKNQQNQDKQDKQDQNKQQQQQKQDQQKTQQQRQQQEKQMSKADAQRILDVLKNSERDVQKKLRTRQAVRPRTEKDW